VVSDVTLAVARVERDHDGAGAQNPEAERREVGNVWEHHRDAVVRLDPLAPDPPGGMGACLPELSIGQLGLVELQRDPIAVPLGCVDEDGRLRQGTALRTASRCVGRLVPPPYVATIRAGMVIE
jgi:hypothetical protein